MWLMIKSRNKSVTAKLLQQGYWYHKIRKTFSKFYRRYYELVSKFNVGLKPLLHQGLSEPEFYGDLVYKLKKKWRWGWLFCSVHHHHHHIHFRALFSSTKGWAFWQVFLEGVLSTQNDFEGQQNPYLASFCHSQALHPMISLACQIFSVQPFSLRTSAIQPVLRSTCLILLVRSTTSKSWMPSFVRRESELTSSFALTLQIQRIMARSLRWRRFSVSTFMAQVSAACSITLHMSTPYLWSEGADGGWWEGEAIDGTCPMHICSVWSQPPPAESMSPR